MDAPINILHLEDSAADALLIERAVAKAGVSAQWRRIADWPALEHALTLDHWHLIVADYNLPGLMFEECLAVIRERRPELPVIVVSGCLGEEKAIDLFKGGAWDLVLKGALNRLGPAIHRALREAAENQARTAAERHLRDSERRLRLTLDAAELAVWDWTPATDALEETGPIATVYGREPGYRHRGFSDFLDAIHPSDRARVEAELRTIAASASPALFTIPFRAPCPDGSVRWLTAVGRLVRDEAEARHRVLGIVRDDTRQKQAETVLHDRLELQHALMEAIPSPIFHKDTDGRYRGCNKAFEDLYHRPRDLIIGRRVLDLTAPENALVHFEADQRLLADEPALVYEAAIHHPDNRVSEMHVSKTTYTHADGTVAGIVGIMIDMTERNQNERRLRQLAIAVEQSPCSIVITDTSGIIEYVNPKFCATSGFSLGEVIGANPSIQKSGYTPDTEYAGLWQTISDGRVWRGELLNRRKDGSRYWENITISPVFETDNTVSHFVGIKEDITDRKHSELAMIDAKERAEAGNQAKTQFLAMMNHEFHTPLNAIIGFAEMMAIEVDPARIDNSFRTYSQIILDSGKSLLQVLDDIVRLSRICAGDVRFQFEPFPLNHLISSAVATVRGRAEAACVRLDPQFSDPFLTFDGDQRALHQALVHLLTNSVKFSNPGANVTLSVRRFDDGHLGIIVHDTGIGIAAADIERVMAPFMQADNSFNRRYDGAGIGLPLAQRLVEHHGGTLEMTSAVGLGTTVTIHLPASRVRLVRETALAEASTDIGRPACLIGS